VYSRYFYGGTVAARNDTYKLYEAIQSSGHIVFFGGAGVSTESGIPDFRSGDGLYAQGADNPEWAAYKPEVILNIQFYRQNPHIFYQYYFRKLVHPGAKPNKAHEALARLEQEGRLKAVITQNIDGLHQEAGSKAVLELHGSVRHNYCTKCKRTYTLKEIMPGEAGSSTPLCECGGMVRPDVVLYGEQLNNKVLNDAISHIRRADMLIVGGTSLMVYPAASLLHYFNGNTLVLINKDETPADGIANMIFREPIGRVLYGALNHGNKDEYLMGKNKY
jgi:NAD-dependent deacetylase